LQCDAVITGPADGDIRRAFSPELSHMRSDMAKVIVERPRHGGGGRYPRGAQPDGPSHELWRRREGIKRPWRRNRKSLNENLAPLWRFLRSRLGRPWDKVYSEVCERINKNSAVQLHAWQHLMQEVVTDPHKVLGDVRMWRCSFLWASCFYVDPKTGLLREKKPTPRKQKVVPKPLDRIQFDSTREYRRLKGIWYELLLEPLPQTGFFRDVVMKQQFEMTRVGFADVRLADEFKKYYGRPVFAAGRRQLGKQEIRWLPIRR
jgi:hypothetical protein